MKNHLYILIIASLASVSLCADKNTVRDPFWPIGYEPPPPPELESSKPESKEPVKPKAPPVQPVTDEDWKMARKLLKINGYASGKIKTGENSKKTSLVMINLKHYTTGDQIKLIHNQIKFVWTVGPIKQNSVELIHTSATRLKPQT